MIANEQVRRSRRFERGASLVEYSLIAGLIAVVAIASLRSTGKGVTEQTLAASCSVSCGSCGYYVTTNTENGCRGWAANCAQQSNPASCMKYLIDKWCSASCGS